MTITLMPTTKTAGTYKLRFQLRDGRRAKLYYRSNIEVSVDTMKDFNKYGDPIRKFGRFDHDVRDIISAEMETLKGAYEYMLKKGTPLTSEDFAMAVDQYRKGDLTDPYAGATLLDAYKNYIDHRLQEGYIQSATHKHLCTLHGIVSRFLRINGKQELLLTDFTTNDLMRLRGFCQHEYEYVDQYPKLYAGMPSRQIPSSLRSNNTTSNHMKMLSAFFNDMVSYGYLDVSPFTRLGRDTGRRFVSETYGDPVYLRASEFQKVFDTKVPEELQQVKDLFLFHCNLGCRVGDLKNLSRARVCVSEDGIPFFRYVAKKTVGRYHSDTETPLMLYSLDILKKYNFSFSLLHYVSGKSGYNNKISKLLKYCGIDRPCKVWDSDTQQNSLKPLYELASSKLCRKTHEDIMVKVQINLYTTGLHRVGSEAIKAYTKMELSDRFRLMCLAFNQPYYTCDQNLEIKTEESKKPSSEKQN